MRLRMRIFFSTLWISYSKTVMKFGPEMCGRYMQIVWLTEAYLSAEYCVWYINNMPETFYILALSCLKLGWKFITSNVKDCFIIIWQWNVYLAGHSMGGIKYVSQHRSLSKANSYLNWKGNVVLKMSVTMQVIVNVRCNASNCKRVIYSSW